MPDSAEDVNHRLHDIAALRAEGLTLDAIGRRFDVSRERVRQLLGKAVRRGLAESGVTRRRPRDYRGEHFGVFRVTGQGTKSRWVAVCTSCGRERLFRIEALRTIRHKNALHCVSCKPRKARDVEKPALARTLYERDGKEAREIASELGVTVGRVYQLVQQARMEGL